MFLYSVSTHSHLVVLCKQYINQVVIKKLISMAPLLVCIFILTLFKYSETSIKRTPSIKRALSRVPKLTSDISLLKRTPIQRTPLLSGRGH